jgi:phosphoribosyl 1,2-cyclic phosphodiesterase
LGAEQDFAVRFWGVRGSIACSGPETARYGGNTSCLEVTCGGHTLILDAGTGLRYAGNAMMGKRPLDLDIFLTHTHFDHVCGLPFFPPLFCADSRVNIWAGHLDGGSGLYDVIRKLMAAPLFPVPPEIFHADLEFKDFRPGVTLTPRPGVCVRTAALNHPNGATGYRVEFAGRSLCYVTDTEHVIGQPDASILKLIDGADLLIYDCMYTDDEFGAKIGWGHSTWQEGVRLSDAAGVGTFVAFHHDPDHDDDFMDGVARDLEKARPGSQVARDGMVLRP